MAAEAAVSFAVETLGKILIEKAFFLKGVKGEVEWLRNELKRMQCFLKDAARKQSDSESIRSWISEIRELAHDAEDAIEVFVLRVQSRGLLWRCVCFPDHIYRLYKVGEEIESIKKRLKEIEDSRLRYGIRDLGDHQRLKSQLQVESRRRLAYWQKDKHVVGLEKDVEMLLGKAIFEKSEGLLLAAVLGMGGIGKSTLASKIYNHPAVAGRFEWRAWVVVSSEFTPEDIMKQILLQLGISLDDLKLLESVDDKLGRQENLKKELHRRLTGKRYFIVLDDVWEATHLESLGSAFPDEDKASRLLLTSRNQVMTAYSQYVHNMKVLDSNQSWELFLRKVFVDNTCAQCPEELKNIAEEILKKCGGLPLAITVVGGILAKKARSKGEWERVLKEMKYHLDTSGDINTISAILELSYQNIPLELKACFLCLGFFKEDAMIEAKDLVHIWVAHGLVRQEAVGEGETMEDVAREYLNELISRNMVQVKESRYDHVKTCQIHDLLRDLSIRKAKEEIDFEVVREEGYSYSHQSLHKPRHRAIYFNRPRFVYSTNRNQCIRSLFFHGETRYFDGGPSSYWKSFELLRVLHLGIAELRVLPKAIGLLTGLRYLKMRCIGGGVSKLPRSWANLKNLEVLDLRGHPTDFIIDRVILNMDSLRHVYVDISYSEVVLGDLRNLRTLSLLRVKDSDLWQIQEMCGASKLGIDMSEISDASTLFMNLAALENLVCLTLKECAKSMNMEGMGTLQRITRLKLHNFRNMRLPRNFPPNLSYLTLSLLWLAEDPMPVLERLPKLLYLKLNQAYSGEEMVVSENGFPSLKILHLEYMNMVRVIEIGKGAIPEIEQLVIRKCSYLETENLPEHLRSVVTDAD